MVGYECVGANVLAYVNRYDWQAQAHEIVADGNGILGQSGWDIASSREATAGSGSSAVHYREITVKPPDSSQWVLGYFYSVGGRNFTGDLPSKLYYGFAAARGRPASAWWLPPRAARRTPAQPAGRSKASSPQTALRWRRSF